jgi:hypothetical protein
MPHTYSVRGIVKVKVLPLPISLMQLISPPSASTMFLTIDNPNPQRAFADVQYEEPAAPLAATARARRAAADLGAH